MSRKIAVVGAGMAGLAVARALSTIADVSIFEKSKGVGGRMATRRIDDACFDHGAQYFTIKGGRFRNALEAAHIGGIVQAWNGAMASLTEDGILRCIASKTIRYVGCPSMNALPKLMSAGLDIRLDAQVADISGEPGRWFLQIRDQREGPFDWVIAAAPAPQSADLLPSRFEHHDALGLVEMNACFTLMIRQKHAAWIPFAAARVDDPVIDWISRNHTKPGRPEALCLVVNSNPVWASINIDKPLELIREQMLEALGLYIPIEFPEAETALIHRWRYANVQRSAGKAFLLDQASQLGACGDWCIGGRVEAAYQSGADLGDALRGMIEVAK